MKITAISDTHGNHSQVEIPEGDIIVHCGDFAGKSNLDEVVDFCDWFTGLNFRHRILVAGNHDRYVKKRETEFLKIAADRNIIYLENRSVRIQNYNFYGSPYSKKFAPGSAFLYTDEPEARKLWNLIPKETDILITHGPPLGYGDYSTEEKKHAGCPFLLEKVKEIKPLLHIFGHIHTGFGIEIDGDTLFANASLADETWNIVNKPLVISLPEK
jgi:Icc-related predicted phosphoesterase